MGHDVFISYSNHDKKTADAVCSILEADGLKCWMDKRDISYGNYASQIIKAIKSSQFCVLILSMNANKSKYVLNEINRAFDNDIPIIPFRIEDIQPSESLELYISTSQWHDAFTQSIEYHIQDLANNLKILLGKEIIEKPPPPKKIITFTDYIEDLGNGIKLEMVAIKGGTFQMGSNDGDDNEKPVHEVTLKDFYIGRYQVTQEQWKAIIIGYDPSYFKGTKNPIECIKWGDAMEFCEKLSEKTGKKYTLPSEAQWEYACRAGSTMRYYFGDDESLLDKYAWYSGNSEGKTHPVGEKRPNNFWLYDMYGNVWEWCLDWYHKNYEGAPADGSAWELKDNNNPYRVLRGGSWHYDHSFCRSAYRYYLNPDFRPSHLIGLRLVRTQNE